MKKRTRLTAAVLSAALTLGGLAVPAAAAEGLTKDESVYITLGADGAVKEQTVSEWLHCDAGLAGVRDVSSLENIVDLKSDALPQRDGEELVWQLEGNDVYYQGTTDRQPPVTAAITYTLDGSPMTAQELLGKSGHLVITVALTNHQSSQVSVDGAQRTVYTPFVTAVGTNLPASGFANVRAEHGTVQTDSNHQIVAFVCLPGMAQSFDGLLTGRFAQLREKFLDTVTIEADVTDFSAPAIMVACASDPSLLSTDADLGDFDQLLDDLDQLKDATQDLIDGARKLADGSRDLNDGVADLRAGVGGLHLGARSLRDGAGELGSGLSLLKSKGSDLNAGASDAANGVLALCNTALGSNLTEPMTWENYAQVLGNLAGIGDDKRAAAKAKITGGKGLTPIQQDALLLLAAAGLEGEEAPDAKLIETAATQAGRQLAAAQESAAEIAAAQEALQEAAPWEANRLILNQMILAQHPEITNPGDIDEALREAAYDALAGSFDPEIGPENVAVIITMACKAAQGDASKVTPELLGAKGAALSSAGEVSAALETAQDGSGASLITNFLTQAVAASLTPEQKQAMAGAASMSQLLVGMEGLKQGVSDYTAGVATAQSGSQALYAGADDLYDGTSELVDGAKKLKDGAQELQDGAQELFDGVKTYNTDGISKLTESKEIGSAQALVDVADAMEAQAKAYTSYAGAPQGVTAKVKFVMKTESVKAAQTSQDSAQAAPAPAQKVSFWTRVFDLFKPRQ